MVDGTTGDNTLFSLSGGVPLAFSSGVEDRISVRTHECHNYIQGIGGSRIHCYGGSAWCGFKADILQLVSSWWVLRQYRSWLGRSASPA